MSFAEWGYVFAVIYVVVMTLSYLPVQHREHDRAVHNAGKHYLAIRKYRRGSQFLLVLNVVVWIGITVNLGAWVLGVTGSETIDIGMLVVAGCISLAYWQGKRSGVHSGADLCEHGVIFSGVLYIPWADVRYEWSSRVADQLDLCTPTMRHQLSIDPNQRDEVDRILAAHAGMEAVETDAAPSAQPA